MQIEPFIHDREKKKLESHAKTLLSDLKTSHEVPPLKSSTTSYK